MFPLKFTEQSSHVKQVPRKSHSSSHPIAQNARCSGCQYSSDDPSHSLNARASQHSASEDCTNMPSEGFQSSSAAV